jgi:hypothetical protein
MRRLRGGGGGTVQDAAVIGSSFRIKGAVDISR